MILIEFKGELLLLFEYTQANTYTSVCVLINRAPQRAQQIASSQHLLSIITRSLNRAYFQWKLLISIGGIVLSFVVSREMSSESICIQEEEGEEEV